VLSRGRVKRFVIRIVSDEYMDLYILAVAALTFTILGFAGVADTKVLAAVTLALLAILLMDPTDDALIHAANEHSQHGITADRLKRRIESTLEELAVLQGATNGDLEIRVTSFIPHMGITAIDIGSPNGLIVLQHYEHRPTGESAPIFSLKPADGFWYEHFIAEAERLWRDGTSWPPGPAVALRRSARPLFKEEFGPELELAMGEARELLITGVTRNTLITSKYHKFEDRLRNGCRVRMLLMEPLSDATIVAAERYYADRTPDSIRERVRHTLRLLAELKRSTGGDLSVRLTSHPIGMGTISVDGSPDVRSKASALFVEYYTYQASGEPKFILQPSDSQWFENLHQEAEALWDNATEYNLIS
jgi:hypothetical protein